MTRTLFLLLALCLAALAGCDSGISNEPLPPEDDDSNATRDTGPRSGGAGSGTRDSGTRDSGGATQPRDSGRVEGSTSDAAQPDSTASSGEAPTEPPEPDVAPAEQDSGASEPPPTAESKIPGSAEANGCTSYTPREGEQCYGFWCGVTEQVLVSELSTEGPCGGLAPKILCDGAVQMQLQMCGIRERTNLLNAFASEDVLRMKIQDCFYEDTSLESVGAECLRCFLDGGQCAGENCLTECLASEGRSAACEQCRFDNNCFQPLPACAGLPSPF